MPNMTALTPVALTTLEHSMAKKTVEIELVKTEAGYRCALKLLSAFFDHPPATGSALEAEFELLMMMVERYEAEHITVKAPDPVAAIEFAIEQRGLSPADLQQVLGSRQRVHDILRKKRRLSLEHVRALRDKLLIPAEVLIQAY
jgi:HTH-type transcriptional regulator / antitoxin HigA